MDSHSQARRRFVREAGAEGTQGRKFVLCSDGGFDAPLVRRLEALAAAAMALGWECVQAAAGSAVGEFPTLDAERLFPELGGEDGRPGREEDWRRFDAAWTRVRREIVMQDLTGVGLALLDFAQACRITADRFAAREPVQDSARERMKD